MVKTNRKQDDNIIIKYSGYMMNHSEGKSVSVHLRRHIECLHLIRINCFLIAMFEQKCLLILFEK